MGIQEPAFTLGVEEEYMLVDPETRDLEIDPPPSLLETCNGRLKDQVGPEFMRSQIEIGTPICHSIAEVRREIARARRTVSDVAREHGLEIIAASTHPFADWAPQKHTARERYDDLARDIGVPVRRLLTCAMHVHIGIQDPDLRIDLMNQMRYFLPHLLALSTSSPFWQGHETGLKSYRLAVFNELPRTGTPEEYGGWSEYEQHLNVLVQTGVIQDGTKLWWDIRPSARFPTLEMRICDICTRIEDCVTITALFACIMRLLWRLKRMNVTWRRYKSLLINENRWRAMRYGFDAGLIDFGKREMTDYGELLDELLDMIREDAEHFGCVQQIAGARDILLLGTSAHRQSAIYNGAIAAGATEQEALFQVIDWLIDRTRQNTEAEDGEPAG